MLIYAADDEAGIRKLLEAFLQAEGYRVRTFETGDLLMAILDNKGQRVHHRQLRRM